MIGGIVTLLALLGFLAIVVYVFVLKDRKDFDEQSKMPLEEQQDSDSNSDKQENGS